jgi:predicted nucleic acid-binding protein
VVIGLDTSVVLCLLIGEPRAQAEVARRRIERALISGEKVIVTDLVAAETFHAPRHHYDVPQTVALRRLQEFFSAGGEQVDPIVAAEALGQGDMRALSTD